MSTDDVVRARLRAVLERASPVEGAPVRSPASPRNPPAPAPDRAERRGAPPWAVGPVSSTEVPAAAPVAVPAGVGVDGPGAALWPDDVDLDPDELPEPARPGPWDHPPSPAVHGFAEGRSYAWEMVRDEPGPPAPSGAGAFNPPRSATRTARDGLPGRPVPGDGIAVPGRPVPGDGIAVPGRPVPGDGIAVPGRPDRSRGDHRTDPVKPPRESAFGPSRLRPFDPGRRGVQALAAVALLVVVVAAFLAWRARPRVDQVSLPPVPGETSADAAATDDPAPRPSATAELIVAVAGKVGKPGVVRLVPGARVGDAIQAAGGARPGVDIALLNPARKVVDGELILVGVSAPPGAPVAAPAGGNPAGPLGPVNLNTATLADLDTLPGVGPVLAQRILDAREAQGGFRTVGDLRKVDGIGNSRYEQLKDLVTV